MPALSLIPNIVVVVCAVVIMLGLLYVCKLTRADGFIWKAAAFGWVVVCRVLLVAGVHPFVVYSSQIVLPFYLLFIIGLWLTITKLRSVYRNGWTS